MSEDTEKLVTLMNSIVSAASKQGITSGKQPEFNTVEAALEWGGTKIRLPEDPAKMGIPQAITWLARIQAEDAKEVRFHEEVKGWPLDAAIAFSRALRERFGWATAVPTPGFFGPNPPTAVDVQTGPGPNDYEQVFWGSFELPGIEGATLQTNADWHAMKFIISGKVRQGNLPLVKAIAADTRRLLKERSIYRGHAITLQLDSDGDLNLSTPPVYMDLSRFNPNELVFSEDLREQITTNLFTPVAHTAACRAAGVPLKRGILLEGPYGTGKTMCATATAALCERQGWTFITIGRVTALRDALGIARLYEPAVVFVEDIDREMSGTERTPEMDDILNTIDGALSKGSEIMVVLTSNNVQAINKAMLRPGRLDAVLHIGPPDAEAARRLIQVYGRGLIPEGEDLTAAGRALAGQIPAVIRECVERAKLYAIGRGDSTLRVLGEDVIRSAKGMRAHLALLAASEPVKEGDTPEFKLGAALAALVNKSLANGHDDPTAFSARFRALADTISGMEDRLEDIHDHVS